MVVQRILRWWHARLAGGSKAARFMHTVRGIFAMMALGLGYTAQAGSLFSASAISQVDTIRDRLRLHDQAQMQKLSAIESALESGSGSLKTEPKSGLVAQWFNWGNWGNWGNWNNWNNWRNF